MDLFESSAQQSKSVPLAARMRPRNLDEYIGQDHIVGKGRLLRRAIAADQLTSVIFYGPPGCGKTTLARVIANHTKSNFITLNAVLTGVADIRAAIKKAEDFFNLYERRTILFVDEVHRWNKSQQDALLPWVENGTIILIGATTENPFFEVNKALVSRSRVFQLKPLTQQDLLKAAQMTLTDKERGYGNWNVQFEQGALEHLIDTANGDARSLLNALELAVETTPEVWKPNANPPVPAYGSTIYISKEACEESIQKKVVLYDRDGDYHYDIISAFIKSLRGRDPDAAMYWLARMVRAGEDAHYIFRRMLISACEDTGLADPHAISVVESCAAAFDRVGLPEGHYFLAHAALYLATAPKSNSSMAFFDALSSVEKQDQEVPNHLKDGSRDAESFGHGDGYIYPHAYRDHWVAQQYLPDALVGKVFYTPTNQGYEGKIKDEVLSRREIQIAAILENNFEKPPTDATCGMHPVPEFPQDFENPIGQWWINQNFNKNSTVKTENLTFSPKDIKKENSLSRADKIWQARLDSNKAEILLSIRNAMCELASLTRASRSLVWNADDALLIWEIERKTPEGITCGLCKSESGKQILEKYAQTLDDLDRPFLLTRKPNFNIKTDLQSVLQIFEKQNIEFDKIFFRDPFLSQNSCTEFAESFSQYLENGGNALAQDFSIIISQKIPASTQRLSSLIAKQILHTDIPATDEGAARPATNNATQNPDAAEQDAARPGSNNATQNLDAAERDAARPATNNATQNPDAAERDAARSGSNDEAQNESSGLDALKRSAARPATNEDTADFAEILAKMSASENEFFSDKQNPLFSFSAESIKDAFEKQGFSVKCGAKIISEKRHISENEIEKWFDSENSSYGQKICENLSKSEFEKIKNLFLSECKKNIFDWNFQIAFFLIERNLVVK